MEMQQVRYFVALADELNFTRAADRCNVSQPALTRAIQQLEHELGGPLFHRERGNTHLSELGRMMLPYLETIHAQTLAAREQAKAVKKLDKVTLDDRHDVHDRPAADRRPADPLPRRPSGGRGRR